MTVKSDHAVVWAGLMPHPPIVVPAVARGRERDVARTIAAMRECSSRLMASGAELLVLISPHSPRRPGRFGVWTTKRLSGSFAPFGAWRTRIDLPNDLEYVSSLRENCSARGIDTWAIKQDDELDHGALVPLYYLAEAGWSGATVVVGLNYPGEGQLEDLGHAIAETADRLGRRAAVLASGDMSHRLIPSAPGGFHPRAHEFDEKFVQLVDGGRFDSIAAIDEELQQLAGEDVVDSSVVALAAAGFSGTNHQLLSYEGPFGVGYTVAVFFSDTDGSVAAEQRPLCRLSDLAGVARAAVETWVREHSLWMPPVPVTGELLRRAGVFVTIRTKDDELRGCIGSLQPTRPNLVEETIDRAIASATNDIRFEPIAADELANLTYEVSILHPPELVVSTTELDPDRYGVILTDRYGRRAVMLPGIESLDTVEKQLVATKRKAGIPANEEVTIERFEVEKVVEERKES